VPPEGISISTDDLLSNLIHKRFMMQVRVSLTLTLKLYKSLLIVQLNSKLQKYI
jgi:hypothetical protein